MMQLEYRLTLKDYQEANQTHFQKMRRLSYIFCWLLSIFFGVIGLLSVIASILLLTGMISDNNLEEPISTLINGCVFLAVAIFVNPTLNLLQRYLIYRNWKSNPSIREPVNIEVTEEGIDFEGATFKSAIKWQIYTNFLESKNLFMLYQSNNLFNMIPKRAFSSNEQINQFRDLIGRMIVKNR